jgi:hypothetical protein
MKDLKYYKKNTLNREVDGVAFGCTHAVGGFATVSALVLKADVLDDQALAVIVLRQSILRKRSSQLGPTNLGERTKCKNIFTKNSCLKGK